MLFFLLLILHFFKQASRPHRVRCETEYRREENLSLISYDFDSFRAEVNFIFFIPVKNCKKRDFKNMERNFTHIDNVLVHVSIHNCLLYY